MDHESMDHSVSDGINNSSKRERTDNWSSRETEALIGVWKSHYVALESINHKRKIYKLVSERLKDLGHDRNIPSVQAKINKLKTLYRKNKPDPLTGNRKPKWRFWDAVHEVVQQPLLRRGIREQIGPGGITRETGPVSPSGADDQELGTDKTTNSKPNDVSTSGAANSENPKEKAKRAKKGPGAQARKKLTIKHEEVLKKLLREEDESQILIQKLNSNYQDTVNSVMEMQKKCNDTLVSLMTVFEGYINANQQPPPQPPPPPPTTRPSMSLVPQSSSPYGAPMNNSHGSHSSHASQHQQQFAPGRPPNNMPQHFQRPQSHFPQPMPSCRPPSLMYQQQQPPPMLPPPPLPNPPTPAPTPAAAPVYPSWNPLNIRTETLLALLLPNLRLGLNNLQAPTPAQEQQKTVKEMDENNENEENENDEQDDEESE